VLFSGVGEVDRLYKTQPKGKYSIHLKNSRKEGQHFCGIDKIE
jgi:hypothetical protein